MLPAMLLLHILTEYCIMVFDWPCELSISLFENQPSTAGMGLTQIYAKAGKVQTKDVQASNHLLELGVIYKVLGGFMPFLNQWFVAT